MGEDSLTNEEWLHIEFYQKFEEILLLQEPHEDRTIYETLDISWKLLRTFPKDMLIRIWDHTIQEHYNKGRT